VGVVVPPVIVIRPSTKLVIVYSREFETTLLTPGVTQLLLIAMGFPDMSLMKKLLLEGVEEIM
jgi:hypothetical protein